MLKALALYVLVAMLSWSPARDHLPTPEAETIARYDGVSLDIATPVSDESEPPLFEHDPDKAETALLVAAVAFYEARYWTYVDEGLCNRRSWRQEKPGARAVLCDGGSAYSFWQIHPQFTTPKGHESGIVLDADGWHYGVDGFKGPDLVANRQAAARVALHMLRASMKKGGSLCGYTGEAAPCPKAKARLELAKTYYRQHPFKPDVEAAKVASR